jgi:hypothetical protein
MRIRLYQAFASNNSGSYTIVGTFESSQDADDIASLLRAVCAEHGPWYEQHAYDEDGESPLERFAREHGLSDERPGRADDWPEHGPTPSITSVGHQVLVHVPYTVTMPRVFGELFYKRGGRVDIELDHAHEDRSVEMAFYVPDIKWNDPERSRRIDALERELLDVLPPLVRRREHDERPVIEPAFHSEVPRGALDHPRRPHRCHEGASRGHGLRAGEAKAALDRLPKEVLVDVDHIYAQHAAETLRAAGCEAEVIVPNRASK